MKVSKDRITYTCGKCGWQAGIQAAWADVKPKWCLNRKCRVSFRLNPDLLQVLHPPKPIKQAKAASAPIVPKPAKESKPAQSEQPKQHNKNKRRNSKKNEHKE